VPCKRRKFNLSRYLRDGGPARNTRVICGSILLDLFRDFTVRLIFLAHILRNVVSKFVPFHYGFSDAAEMFRPRRREYLHKLSRHHRRRNRLRYTEILRHTSPHMPDV